MRIKALRAARILLECASGVRWADLSATFGTTCAGKHESKLLPPAESEDVEYLNDYEPRSFSRIESAAGRGSVGDVPTCASGVGGFGRRRCHSSGRSNSHAGNSAADCDRFLYRA